MICSSCQQWILPVVDRPANTIECPECGHKEARLFLPLFIVTGPSGAGKTAVVPELQRLLPDWEIFETDILWDSAGDWNMVKCNWLRIAENLAQRPHGRPTILCGTIQPDHIEECDCRHLFSTIYWLALTSEPHALAIRLRERPVWRGCDEAFITRQLAYLQWLHENAATAFDPPLKLLGTTDAPVQQTAEQIRDWAIVAWEREQQ